RAQVQQLLDHAFGVNAIGCQGFFLVIHSNAVAPAHIALRTRETLTAALIEKSLNLTPPGVVHATATSRSNVFQLTVSEPVAARDYLAWSDPLEKDFNEIREALKRPYARFDCDYSRP